MLLATGLAPVGISNMYRFAAKLYIDLHGPSGCLLLDTAHCISLYWEGDLRNLSYFLNTGKELEFYNCNPTEDKE